MRLIQSLALSLAAVATLAAAHREYKVEVREPVRHTFSNCDSLDVDAISGSITVMGDNGNTIRVEGEKVIRAADQAEADRAKRDVVLDINEKDRTGQLYVNGPFRNNDHASENHGFHDHSDREYDVAYNLTIHVPRAIALRLRTVNGSLKAEETGGKFDLKTINGGISMSHIAGSGSADSLNGSTVITFRENPKADSFFKSFNGKVDVTFQPNLAAEMQVKTFNGGAYTDFDVTALASPGEPGENKNGRFVYKSNRVSRMRVGSGGPELKFETFNGNIQIRK